MQLINRVPTLRFYAKRGRRGEEEANPHIHHPFRSRWSLKFPQLPSSHLTGNISVQFLAPRNRRSFARLEPRESPDQTPPPPPTTRHAWPRMARRWSVSRSCQLGEGGGRGAIIVSQNKVKGIENLKREKNKKKTDMLRKV